MRHYSTPKNWIQVAISHFVKISEHAKGYRNPLLIITATASLFIIYSSPGGYQPMKIEVVWNFPSSHYLVDNVGCKLIDLDPFDPMVKGYWSVIDPVKCKQALIHLKNSSTLVWEGNKGLNWKGKAHKCCYKGIKRVEQDENKYDKDADFMVKIEDKCRDIPKGGGAGVKVEDEQYIKVECTNKLKVKVWQDFFPIVLPPEKLSNKTREKAAFWRKKEKPPSVMIIGIDSISRLHMQRSLPDTKKYLQTNDFLTMEGYTKVGDNTFPNIMAGFAGMRDKDWPKCWPTRQTKMDNCSFIWDNFSDINYVTALIEDSPGLSIFNYEKTGFVKPPVDYYIRPLMLAEMKHYTPQQRFGGSNRCLAGGLTPTNVLLRYVQSFVEEVSPKSPFFLLSWFTSCAHDVFNGLLQYDKSFKNILESLVRQIGEDTVLIFMSDHGYRFGSFRETFMGFYEEALPFFFIRLPPSLKTKYPQWYENLKTNQHRLTSPHDLYATFTDIYKLTHDKEGKTSNFTTRSPSLFEVGPMNRTCESSDIPQKYCICGVSRQASSSNDLTKELSQFIVDFVNSDLKKKGLLENGTCMELTFSKFLYGREVGKGDKWNQHGILEPYRDYLIAVETSPWEGRFEARVRRWHERLLGDKNEILGSVSRINSYEGKSNCIGDYIMKNYCICTTLWEKERGGRKKKKH